MWKSYNITSNFRDQYEIVEQFALRRERTTVMIQMKNAKLTLC